MHALLCSMARAIACALLPLVVATNATAAATPPDPFAEATKSATKRTGLLATWLDAKTGKLLLELPRPSGPRTECGSYLYVSGLRSGLGSNPVGLDRGLWADAKVVVFRRIGSRVLLEEPNQRYRAQSSDSNEVRAVRESFAASVLWGGEVVAEGADGSLLIDFTSFLTRDAQGVVAALKTQGQGSFQLDKERSALDPSQCLSFPDNLEFESILTFASDEPGSEVRATAPTPQAVTLVQHQSLARLPDAGYRPRRWDPRSGSFEVMFADYAQPVASDLEVRWLVRHRLEKLDPAAARSRVKKPIIYYVDPGAPEPIRSALVEGASWWAKAFEEAGFLDAFQVRLLPPDAHPLDIRYNVIQWVHRATRGWSYGGGVIDPRTGEMIKGSVVLGSLRIRQDRLIFEGLAGTEQTGSGAPDDPVQLGLARIRQLAAHEVGHTLGFSHNFAASTYAGRASVMDYPAPLISFRADGTLDFSDAYAAGVGAWDIQQVRYAYSQFPPGTDESAALEAILAENRDRGYRYLADRDARGAGAAHPLASLWDNGSDPIAELGRVMDVRRAALDRFGERNIPVGEPLSTLSEVLAPLYFHHRYQTEAAAKSIGGVDYAYSVRGDGGSPARPVSAERQRAAIEAVLSTLNPVTLDLPDAVIERLLPQALDDLPRRERFVSRTAPIFDALGAAASAADLTLAILLPPERLARLVDQHRRDRTLPGVEELLDAIVERVFSTSERDERVRAVRGAIQSATVRRLLMAAADPKQTTGVRAALEDALVGLAGRLSTRGGSAQNESLGRLLAADIRRYLDRPLAPAPSAATAPGAPADPPPGPPIGALHAADDCEWWRQAGDSAP